MNKSRSILVVTVFLILFLSCKKYVDQPPVMSFCYWKTTFSIDSTDASNLNKFGANHLYLRLFDVDWDVVTKSPTPVAQCQYSYRYSCTSNLTPTIFITNSVFENIKEDEMEEFADKFTKKATDLRERIFDELLSSQIENDSNYQKISTNYEDWEKIREYRDSVMEVIKPKYYNQNKEILIDCDWTPSTKTKYFKFLEIIKTKMVDIEITSTLRLWQYRDYKLAGVPPVKKCLLMCYNLTDPRKYETENSIATTEEFKKYINHSDYPLKLDIALPIHSWAIYFRNNKYKGIINSIPVSEITGNKQLFEKKSDQKYMFLKDTVINETYYRFGDEFRIEQVDFKTLVEFAQIIKQYIKIDKTSKVTFFSWDAQFYNRFTKDEYKQILNAISE